MLNLLGNAELVLGYSNLLKPLADKEELEVFYDAGIGAAYLLAGYQGQSPGFTVSRG